MGGCQIGFHEHQAAAIGPHGGIGARQPFIGRQRGIHGLLPGVVDMGGSEEAGKTPGTEVKIQAGFRIATDDQGFGAV